MTPLLFFWWRRAASAREAFIAGWLTQFILNLIGFHWIAYTAIEFGHFPVSFGVVVLIGFAAIAHLYYPVGGWIGFHLNRRMRLAGAPALFTYALTFAICDRLFTSIFPWHLGYPWLWAGWPGAQFADVIGFEGLNILTIMVNACLAWAVADGLFQKAPNRKAAMKPWTRVGAALTLIAIPNLLGLGRAEKWKATDAELRVLTIQGNIGNFEKYMAELQSNFAGPIVKRFIDLSQKGAAAHPDAQLMLWPETAFPSFLDREYLMQPLQFQVRNLIRQTHMPLVTGSYSNQYGTKDVYNGLFFLDANGDLPFAPYRKTILLVFGETFPFSDYIPYMDKLFPEQGSFARGSGPTVFRVQTPSGTSTPQTVSLGPQICYEGLYPWFSAGMARKGAQIFINVTNDSWFWKPFEPNQHLYMTLARAVEFRRPLVRSTNTGISTAILASGEVLEKSPIGREWFGMFRIPYISNPEHTFYERYGGAWPWLLAASLATLVIFGRNREPTE